MESFSRVCLAALVALSCVLLAGCQQAPAPTSSKTVKEGTASKPQTVLSYIADGSAADNQEFFEQTAAAYAGSDAEFSGVSLVNTFAAAGFLKPDMQVSFDKSPLNHDADSLFLGVRFDQECLIAQIMRQSREYTVTRVKAAGPDRVCLIGKTREINW